MKLPCGGLFPFSTAPLGLILRRRSRAILRANLEITQRFAFEPVLIFAVFTTHGDKVALVPCC